MKQHRFAEQGDQRHLVAAPKPRPQNARHFAQSLAAAPTGELKASINAEHVSIAAADDDRAGGRQKRQRHVREVEGMMTPKVEPDVLARRPPYQSYRNGEVR